MPAAMTERPHPSGPLLPPSLPSIHVSSTLLCGMSCCHSLAVLDGELIGDPVGGSDLPRHARHTRRPARSVPHSRRQHSLVALVVLPLSSSAVSRQLVRVLHQYEFQSSLQRMSVLCSDEAGRTLIFTKGAPEVVARLCAADSLPHDYTDTFSRYARHGYRIIAIAYKQLAHMPDEDKDVVRPQLESELTMLGLHTARKQSEA